MKRAVRARVAALAISLAACALPHGAIAGSVARADAPAGPDKRLLGEMNTIRARIMALEDSLVTTARSQRQARANIRKIQQLIGLQRRERELTQKRLGDLSRFVEELETRRKVLRERILVQQETIHRFLISLEGSMEERTTQSQERLDAPRRKVLANLADRGLLDIEALKVDLSDAEKLETNIQEEKQQLTYLTQDLKEKEGVLELNRQLQADIMSKSQGDHFAQLESYQKLKTAEARVEDMIGEFNSRLELERLNEAERTVSKAMNQSEFARLKGQLPLPVAGKVVSGFGRAYDPKSQLYIFRKGIEISTGKNSPVTAISPGKVAYSGELPDYGRVAIVDHGDHFYSLCAHLGELAKKAGDAVVAGDLIGSSDGSGDPVYFEIRSRNIAVNPLQWLAN